MTKSRQQEEIDMQTRFEAVTVPLEYNDQGVIRISGTRVSLDSVMYAYNEGATPEEIVYRFPSLRLDDVYAVISYALKHPDLIAAYLQEQQDARIELERYGTVDNLRVRLLARRTVGK